MSDDLVKRLREDQPVTQDMESTMQCALQDEAADRIEELEAKLAKAVAFIEDLSECQWPLDAQAKRILAELTGGKDDNS